MIRHRSRRLALALALSVGAFVVPATFSSAAEEQLFPTQLVRVNAPTYEARDVLTNLGLDLTEHGGHDYVEVVLHTPADASRLLDNGFTWTVTIPDLALRQRQNNEISTAYAQATTVSPLPSGRDTYRTLADYNNDLRTLATSTRASSGASSSPAPHSRAARSTGSRSARTSLPRPTASRSF